MHVNPGAYVMSQPERSGSRTIAGVTLHDIDVI